MKNASKSLKNPESKLWTITKIWTARKLNGQQMVFRVGSGGHVAH
jgi:hypothetical protein